VIERFSFRAWDKGRKQMERIDSLYWFEENGVRDGSGIGHHAEYVLMQCTGLRDKNGTLIFEGDILKCFMGKSAAGLKLYANRAILFSDSEKGFVKAKNERNGYTLGGCQTYVFKSEDHEIIGNVYENLDLLDYQKNEWPYSEWGYKDGVKIEPPKPSDKKKKSRKKSDNI